MRAEARQWLLTIVAGAGLLAGCAVGPDYKRPTTTPPEMFRGQTDPAEAASLADLPWWEAFRDPTLQELLQTALANNYDLRVAVARVEQARALAAVARGAFFPSIGYDSNIERARGGAFGSVFVIPGQLTPTLSTFVGLFTASWELDMPRPSRRSRVRLRRRRTRSVSCWGVILARSRAARRCSSNQSSLRFRRGCRPRSSTGARTFGNRSSSWCRPTRRSAWPRPTSSRSSI